MSGTKIKKENNKERYKVYNIYNTYTGEESHEHDAFKGYISSLSKERYQPESFFVSSKFFVKDILEYRSIL